MFVKSNVGLCVRESGRSVSALVGVAPIVQERAPVAKEQSSNLLIGESSYNTGVADINFIYGMFASRIFDLLTSGVIIKALWFDIEGEMSRARLLREYIDNPGPVGAFPLIRDQQFDTPTSTEMNVAEHNKDTFVLEITNTYGSLILKERHTVCVPYSIRTGRGLTPNEREQALLAYVTKHPPVTQPKQILCELRQEPVILNKGGHHYEVSKQEGITMYYIS